jgi:transglutaminase-like putative cysteine protease
MSANKSIRNVHELKELKIRLEGLGANGLFLDGGRQSFNERVLTIRKESILNLSQKEEEKFQSERTRYLKATPFIQSDHPEIRTKAKEIVSEGDPDIVKAKKLVAWVHQNIQKRPVLSVPNALETLRNRVGDCNEHAVLLAALARASGIPAEIEAGLVYQNGRFYYHAWNVLHLERWITADAAMGQLPADVTHLRFVRGTEQQIDLMQIIGKVKLEILSETR